MTYLVLAALLIAVLVFAALSKRAEMSVVTMPIVFTGLGWLTWLAGAELIGGEEGREVLHLFAELTLILLLFADATRVRIGELLGNAGIPARMLLIGMPLTLTLGTALAMWVSPNQPWALALLVAAILTPTDAARSGRPSFPTRRYRSACARACWSRVVSTMAWPCRRC